MNLPKADFENTLRPTTLTEFVGHDDVKQRLNVLISAAKMREEPLGHILFYGPPGLGKTTLAHIIANEMNSRLIIASGPSIEKAGDLAGILTSLTENSVLFIDEIHSLSRNIEEYLYPAIEDFKLDLMLDSGTNARSVHLNLNRFTLVAATTRVGNLSAPLRSRMNFSIRLEYYSIDELTSILKRSASLLQCAFDDHALFEIAKRSRGTPRIANNLVKWVRDYAQAHHIDHVKLNDAINALNMLHIDEAGLDEMDKKILSHIIEHYEGGPVGLQSLAVAIGEEPTTLAEVYEPFLIMQGYLKRTSRGREATHKAYKHIEKHPLKLGENT